MEDVNGIQVLDGRLFLTTLAKYEVPDGAGGMISAADGWDILSIDLATINDPTTYLRLEVFGDDITIVRRIDAIGADAVTDQLLTSLRTGWNFGLGQTRDQDTLGCANIAFASPNGQRKSYMLDPITSVITGADIDTGLNQANDALADVDAVSLIKG